MAMFPVELSTRMAPFLEVFLSGHGLSVEEFDKYRSLYEDFVVGRLRVEEADAAAFVDSLHAFGVNKVIPGKNFTETFVAYGKSKRARPERTSPPKGGYSNMLRGHKLRHTYPPVMEVALCAEPVAGFFEEFKDNLAIFVADFFTLSLDKAEIVVNELHAQGPSTILPGDNLNRLITFHSLVAKSESEVLKAVRKPRKIEEIVEEVEVPHVPGDNVWSAPIEDEPEVILEEPEVMFEEPEVIKPKKRK